MPLVAWPCRMISVPNLTLSLRRLICNSFKNLGAQFWNNGFDLMNTARSENSFSWCACAKHFIFNQSFKRRSLSLDCCLVLSLWHELRQCIRPHQVHGLLLVFLWASCYKSVDFPYRIESHLLIPKCGTCRRTFISHVTVMGYFIHLHVQNANTSNNVLLFYGLIKQNQYYTHLEKFVVNVFVQHQQVCICVCHEGSIARFFFCHERYLAEAVAFL